MRDIGVAVSPLKMGNTLTLESTFSVDSSGSAVLSQSGNQSNFAGDRRILDWNAGDLELE